MLTDTKLRSLKPREDAYRVADTNGLCIEVRPSGVKAWRYRYRYSGKASMITLAEYPNMLLSEARAERGVGKARAPSDREGSGEHRRYPDHGRNGAGATDSVVQIGEARRCRDSAPDVLACQSCTAQLAERKKMMQEWADYLDTLSLNANVLPMRRGGEIY